MGYLLSVLFLPSNSSTKLLHLALHKTTLSDLITLVHVTLNGLLLQTPDCPFLGHNPALNMVP